MSICSSCGTRFSCAMADATSAAAGADPQPCWCTYLPAALPVPTTADAGCWCPECLKAHLAAHPAAADPAVDPAADVAN